MPHIADCMNVYLLWIYTIYVHTTHIPLLPAEMKSIEQLPRGLPSMLYKGSLWDACGTGGVQSPQHWSQWAIDADS